MTISATCQHGRVSGCLECGQTTPRAKADTKLDDPLRRAAMALVIRCERADVTGLAFPNEIRAVREALSRPATPPVPETAVIENLAAILRRMIWSANKEIGDTGMKVLAGNARQLLKQYGLEGDLLRHDAALSSPPVEPAAGVLREGLERIIDCHDKDPGLTWQDIADRMKRYAQEALRRPTNG